MLVIDHFDLVMFVVESTVSSIMISFNLLFVDLCFAWVVTKGAWDVLDLVLTIFYQLFKPNNR